MISPISGTYSTNQTSKQNRARVIEIKNKLTVTRGEGGGFSGTCTKDTWLKLKRKGSRVGSGDGWVGGEMETTVLEQQLNNKK